MKQVEIYPCVCEGVPEIKSLLDENRFFYISCTKCQKKTDSYYSMKKAIKAWNKWMKQERLVKYLTTEELDPAWGFDRKGRL